MTWCPSQLKMSSYQYRNDNCEDKIVSWWSYLYNGNPIPRKTVFILRWGLGPCYVLKLATFRVLLCVMHVMPISIEMPTLGKQNRCRIYRGKRNIYFSDLYLNICWKQWYIVTGIGDTDSLTQHQPSGVYDFDTFRRIYTMMTSWNGNIFCVTGSLWGEFTGHWWIPLTKASDTELWCFLWSAPE